MIRQMAGPAIAPSSTPATRPGGGREHRLPRQGGSGAARAEPEGAGDRQVAPAAAQRREHGVQQPGRGEQAEEPGEQPRDRPDLTEAGDVGGRRDVVEPDVGERRHAPPRRTAEAKTLTARLHSSSEAPGHSSVCSASGWTTKACSGSVESHDTTMPVTVSVTGVPSSGSIVTVSPTPAPSAAAVSAPRATSSGPCG